MGNGTNLIVRDKGIRGIVIKILEGFKNIRIEENVIEAEAGVLLSELSKFALSKELGGFEFAHGIPGTFGGAVCMNAGAYGSEIKDVVFKTEIMDNKGNVSKIEGDAHQFGYRKSYIQENGYIVLKSWIRLRKEEKSKIKELMTDLDGRRKDKQPLDMPSAGSVFRRPEGFFVGKLIEDSGLKGYTIGGAQVSSKHCGFIVNAGNAKTKDVTDLILYIQKTIKEKFDVELITEVKIVGEI